MFELGALVKIKKSCPFYGQHSGYGKIIARDIKITDSAYSVKWSDGYQNIYLDDWLEMKSTNVKPLEYFTLVRGSLKGSHKDTGATDMYKVLQELRFGEVL